MNNAQSFETSLRHTGNKEIFETLILRSPQTAVNRASFPYPDRVREEKISSQKRQPRNFEDSCQETL